MTKKLTPFISLLALTLFAGSCTVDNRSTPQPQPSLQQHIFDEEFNNDRNGWSFADPANLAYGVVSNGTFKFDYNDDLYEAYYASKFFGFNPYDDFTIEARIGSSNTMGILFGFDDDKGTYGYSFTIDYDGYYTLYDEGGNGYGTDLQTIFGPETGNFVEPYGDWNNLKIEQRGNRWIGYVNNVQVFNIDAQNMKANGVGFVDVAKTQGEADYLVVSWYN